MAVSQILGGITVCFLIIGWIETDKLGSSDYSSHYTWYFELPNHSWRRNFDCSRFIYRDVPYFFVSRAPALRINVLMIRLMLAILLLAAEKHKATFIAPIGIGLALFVAELLGVYYTGGSLNPARSFGPDVVLGQFAGYRASSFRSRR